MQSVYSYTLPPDKLEQAVYYAQVHEILHFGGLLISILALWGLLKLRLVPRMRALNPALIVALVVLIISAFDVPGEMYSHSVSLRFNISVQSWSSWFGDLAKANSVAVLLACATLIPFYWLVRRSPRRWWFWTWLACIPLSLLLTYSMPLLIEPLFNKFDPLATRRPELIRPIELLLARSGVAIPRDQLYEMDASRKTNSLNAYVSGFGPSRRMVLYDTIIAREQGPPLLATIGHELGHYVLHHISRGLLFGWGMSLVFIFAGYHAVNAFVSHWGPSLDIPRVSDWASLPVVLLVAAVLGFLAEPIGNAFSRAQEREADLFSLEVIHGVVPDPGQAAAQAFQIEGETDLAVPHPNPLVVFWTYSHPPISDRVHYSLAYRPWEKGNHPQFVK